VPKGARVVWKAMQAQYRGSLAHCLSREREGPVSKRQSLQFKM